MSKRRTHSDKFKRKAVQLTNHPGFSKNQIARELGTNANMTGRWHREFQACRSKAPLPRVIPKRGGCASKTEITRVN